MAVLNHMGLTVRNLEASVGFYRDVVGMTVESSFELANEGFAALTNNPAASLKGAFLRAGSFMLQILEYKSGGGTPASLHHNNPGSPHLSFAVADVRAKFEEVRAQPHVKITSRIVEVVPNVHSFYVDDPDGVPVEFFQYLRPE
jgi:catechol 2,3-dioxygenase-like lactoylglutathione lyase family enzyme